MSNTAPQQRRKSRSVGYAVIAYWSNVTQANTSADSTILDIHGPEKLIGFSLPGSKVFDGRHWESVHRLDLFLAEPLQSTLYTVLPSIQDIEISQLSWGGQIRKNSTL